MRAKRYAIGRRAILEWILAEPDSLHRIYMDVVNRDFVAAYIEAAKPHFYLMPYGADKCPELGRVLAQMYRDHELQRHATGLNGIGMGFPKWVWSYHLEKHVTRRLLEVWRDRV